MNPRGQEITIIHDALLLDIQSLNSGKNVSCPAHFRDSSDHRYHRQENSRLMDYLSEDEEADFHIEERDRIDKHRSEDSRHRKKRRRRDISSKPVNQTQCRYYMEGRCHKGKDCLFAHDFHPPKKYELCKFYAAGVCSKGPSCLYLHGEFPCKFFHLSGKCIHGESCKFSHDPLSSSSRVLLDQVNETKDSPYGGNDYDSCRTRGNHLGHDDPGDVDYRFGRMPFTHLSPPLNLPPKTANFDHPSPPRSLIPTPPNPRPRIFPTRNLPDSLDPIEFRPPFNVVRPDRPPRPGFVQEHRFPFGALNHAHGCEYPPTRFPNLRLIGDGSFRPPNTPGVLPIADQAVRLLTPMNVRPVMHLDSPRAAEFMRFRPPFCPTPTQLPVRGPLPIVHPNNEAIVSSELDKMAILLASSKSVSKDPTTPTSSVPVDPRSRSPAGTPNLENQSHTQESESMSQPPEQSDGQLTRINPPEELQRRTSLPFSSPELSVVPLNTPCTPTTSVPWKLIQLDMSVKIPYPLMQLPIEDLPHRFDDPRLRGQLTAFRPHLKSNVNGGFDLSVLSLEPHSEERSPEGAASVINPTQRRPVKLQLNEMASTFANSSPPVAPVSRSGFRSYLDDPRFRRRRVVTAITSSQNNSPNVLTDAIDHEGSPCNDGLDEKHTT
ncbi:unnamed protein product [Calicophoron daubneyi]|uniref:C3H1-type domain-containing protein n=1 Tax=Calicophoron daubneyi TaxID=300641 RepID=A0AAV2T8C5_CALDB